ncbi:hypothetical protein [Hominenteromicrobium sp.]|uniref:hypothetical protein n=1 Tax=Hominenteromicrobium sp. TaxID=3073581 RepID=UPI003AF152E9
MPDDKSEYIYRMVKSMAEFATNGKANAALTTGIIGTAGTGLALLNGGLGGLFSGWNRGGCNEDHVVDRYEAGQAARIAQLETEVKLRDANTYTDQKLLEVYKYFDGRTRALEASDAAQAVTNQRVADSFEAVHNDIVCTKNELYSAIRNEAEKRCCGDNSIVTYANATFYPKMVADVTTGTATTAQPTYNPIPQCGCGCGCN